MRETLRLLHRRLLVVMLGALLAAGCSTSDNDSALTLIDAQGNHPQGFLSSHPVFAVAAITQCTVCHGSALTGGIAKVSCFTSACHHGTVPTWALPAVHGASAKQAPGNSGFAACQICHGNDFSGGGAGIACATCHGVNAPHPPKPWRIAGATANTHTNTDPADAAVCAGCHFPGAVNNPAGHPPAPAPAGTPPGCFNSTLCHGTAAAPHILGATWLNATSSAFHGLAAKPDLVFCQGCHGTPGTIFFDGGTTSTKCSTCHLAAKAHPTTWYLAPSPFPNYVASHRDAGKQSTVCAVCHNVTAAGSGPMAGAPSCFSASFTNADGVAASCHANGPGAPHILGPTWLNPTSAAFHGLAAKPDLVFCQGCHGTPGTIFFDGGTTSTKCSTCHLAAKAHPTTWYLAPSPFPNYVASHRDAGKLSTVCAVCHNVTAAGSGPMAGAPSCFSASFTNADGVAASCHANGPAAANHAVPFVGAVHFQATPATVAGDCANCHAAVGTSPVSAAPLCTLCHAAGSPLILTNCTSCHAAPPSGGIGAAYPNIAGNHALHLALNSAGTAISCDTCHNGLGTNTLNHYNRANARPGFNALRVPPGDVAFLTTYNAKTGASTFDNSAALSCGNVSCHGGQTTPNWQTGALNVNTQCTSCHALGTAQFNSYNSGQHNRAEHRSRACTVCHNTTTLAANHFTSLSTTVMEGPASATIGGAGTNVITYVPATRSCTPSCHGNETW